MSTISVMVITKNEEGKIQSCLESARWADEIVILDSGSTDKTVEICRLYTDKIWQTDWPGYGVQKQRALEKVTSDWVLSVDADEVLQPELIQQIQRVIDSPQNQYDAYTIRHRFFYMGKELKFCFGNKNCLRLFRRNSASFSSSAVHEGLEIKGDKIGKLTGSFCHYSYHSVSHWIDKMNRYTSLSAQIKKDNGKHSGLCKAIGSALFVFFKHYIFKGGIIEGKYGLIFAINLSIANYLKYIKVWYNHES